jgi:FkbM family methyltransferase
MEQFIKAFLQGFFQLIGYQIRRLEKGVSFTDAYSEQQRLLAGYPTRVVFDIGAANGRTSSKYRTLFPEAKLYAFEPLPASYKELAKFCETNTYTTPLNYAVTEQAGKATFHITALDDSSSLLPPNVTGSTFDRHHKLQRTIEVNTITIDQICAQYNIDQIDVLKLDTQGAELSALKGASKMLSEKRVRLVYSEIQFIHLYQGAAQFYEINAYLASHGYKLFNLYNFSHNQKGQLAWGDAIFLHPDM